MLAAAGWAPAAAQLAPPSTGGAVALDHLLQRLAESRRVLVIGAHPDDEDTAFLTLASRGYGADAAYLSLCRGEGGQNLVGDELGTALGLLRTGELASARSVDGARQFFTRAYDFGFSKTLEETSRFWQPDSLLKDVVRVIRRFRPHVVVTIYTGTRSDGHGHHQAAGVLAGAAFAAAGDPARFPELKAEEGVEPWTPLKLYRSAWLEGTTATLELPTGSIDPRSGRSYQQIAMASRSRHRSQDMGRPQPVGPATTRLRLLEDRTGLAGAQGQRDALFLGIPADTGRMAALADSLRHEVTVARLSAVAEPLARFVAAADTAAMTAEVRRMTAEALAISGGLVVDARAASAALVPGRPVEVVVELYNGGPFDVEVGNVTMRTPEGWAVRPRDDGVVSLPAGALFRRRFTVTPGAEAKPTQPYYLERPLTEAMYDWSRVPPEIRGLPLQPPELSAAVEVRMSAAAFALEREVTYRHVDRAIGEIREPVRVVPAVDVKLEPAVLVWPAGETSERTFTVTLVNNGDGPVSGVVGLETEGLPTPATIPFDFERAGESRVVRFRVTQPAGVQRARARVRAFARADDGRVFDRGVVMVAYPHIRPVSMVVEALADVRVEAVRLPRARRVGYVRGAADRVPEALRQVGIHLELLDGEALARDDLSQFDAIVVGSRAYETDTAPARHNARLLSYVERGGRLIVLYQQYKFSDGRFAPFELEISRPHDRITDETVPVTVLRPGHAVFTTPNRITEADWEGWPQERGLYFAGAWDDAYTPLLEMADPGGKPVRGGLLTAEYGEGTYVYTGLSFFRAIPAGVPGAYRLLLNLLDPGDEAVP